MLPDWNSAYLDSFVRQMDDSCNSNEDDSTVDSSNPDCWWLEEDRLQETPQVNAHQQEVVPEKSAVRSSHEAALDMTTFYTVCDFLSVDSSDTRLSRDHKKRMSKAPRENATVVNHKAAFGRATDCPMGDVLVPPVQPPPMPPTASLELISRKLTERTSYDSSLTLDVNLDARAPSTSLGARAQVDNSNTNNSGGVRAQAINSGGVRDQDNNSGGVRAQANNSSGFRAQAINSGGVRAQAINSGGVRAQAINSGGVRAQAINSGVVRAQSINSGGVRDQAINSGGVRAQAINSGGVRAQAINSSGARAQAINSGGARTKAIISSGARAQANNSNAKNSIGTKAQVKNGKAKSSSSAGVQVKNSNANDSSRQADNPVPSQAVVSGRSLADIEAAVERTRNNSNQQQRYEMRGGHAVEICSQVDFPDQATRVVSVTVEATHSNGCHRVVMLKGLTATKRPDLGPKVKDCRLRMDQIVLTRPSVATNDWQKSITMSYDSDFQVGLDDDKNQSL